MTTRKEVARLAGVSEATVSRTLSGSAAVKPATRHRVLKAAKTLNYTPSAVARSFARGRSGNLGVVMPYVPKVHLLSAHYFSELLSGIGDAVRESGYSLMLLFRSPDERIDYVSHFHSRKVDALVVLGARDRAAEVEALRRLREEKLPFCLVNQYYADEAFPAVEADHREGSALAVRFLLRRGCTRIAFLNGPGDYSNSADRLRGYRQALREAGIRPDSRLLFAGNYSHKSGYAASLDIAGRIPEIDAVFAANDRMAIGLMQGLKERGIVPGRDVAVVGYDDSDAAKLADPPLTSVRVPLFEMGRLAALRVLEQAERGDWFPFHEKLETEMVVRKSCGGETAVI
jgi:LacI family transcriptional regulator